LDQIKFPLMPTDEDFRREYTLIGGRYCSIRIQRAAQLRVRKNATGPNAHPVHHVADR